MRLARSLVCVLLASSSVVACTASEPTEDLGNIGDGKADAPGVIDRQITVAAGETKTVTFDASSAFRLAIAQPATAVADRAPLETSLTRPDGSAVKPEVSTEPGIVLDPADGGGTGTFTLAIKNTSDRDATLVLNVRPLGGFGTLPNPNGALFPELAWAPPAIDQWPASYVIFNNPGCGRACQQTDTGAMAPRSVMIKMLVAAIHGVKDGGIVRVSNFNISSSQTAKPVVDALVWAIQERHATVKIVMDEGQNNAMSKTTWLAQNGAQVRFLNGLTYTNSVGPAVGIMHSKIVAVDDQVVFTGSNNFSSTGFVTNEENSVVLRGPQNAQRIASFVCDIDRMFDIGVEAGQPQNTDDVRHDALLALDSCNGPDVWFPPTGVIATGSSITYSNVARGIYGAKRSVSLAPDMMAHPGIISALVSRAKQLHAQGATLRVRLVVDASAEAFGNPAFGDCLVAAAARDGLDMQVRYWRGTPEIFQLMHHKFMLIDEDDPQHATLFNGSANYSAKALKESFENVTRYRASEYREIVDAFTARFQKMYAAAQDKDALAAAGITVPACTLDLSTL